MDLTYLLMIIIPALVAIGLLIVFLIVRHRNKLNEKELKYFDPEDGELNAKSDKR